MEIRAMRKAMSQTRRQTIERQLLCIGIVSGFSVRAQRTKQSSSYTIQFIIPPY
jgi:hypothetical protein